MFTMRLPIIDFSCRDTFAVVASVTFLLSRATLMRTLLALFVASQHHPLLNYQKMQAVSNISDAQFMQSLCLSVFTKVQDI